MLMEIQQRSLSMKVRATEIVVSHFEIFHEFCMRVFRCMHDRQAYSTCSRILGGPLFAEFAENYKSGGDESSGTDLNKAGSSSHECVNAKANGNGSTVKQPFQSDTACQRPKDYDEQWYVLVGVLSFGSTVCGTEVPVVYTRVTAYLQWIAYITGRHG
jgi:hypothetical protein